MKKRKISILVQVAVPFLLSGLIAFASIYNYIYNNTLERAVIQADEVAGAAANSVLAWINTREELEKLYTDTDFRDEIYEAFRFVCQKTDIRYLYLYTIGEDQYRHYIICAAEYDEDNDRMQEEYGFGSVRKLPLYNTELSILNGRAEKDHELINKNYGYVCMHTAALRDTDGSIMALVGADYNMANVEREAWRNLTRSGLLVVMGQFITFIIALLLIWWYVLRPVRNLSERMRLFAMDRKEIKITRKRKKRFENEITEIENAFNRMTTDIHQYVQENEVLTRKEAYTNAQLDVARNIQKGIVPEKTSICKDHFEVCGFSKPAREVGGDFYDVFSLENGQECFVIGDISGKGISAARVHGPDEDEDPGKPDNRTVTGGYPEPGKPGALAFQS